MKPCILLDGAFDPLHAGHIHYITSAKLAFPEYRLVVSVCSDDDIRAKGREPLLTQSARGSIVGALRAVDSVYLKTIPTEQVIASLKPAAYIKGKDWEGKLPDEQLAACSLYGVQIVYLNTVIDSATDRLRAWALKDAEQSLDRLETFMVGQDKPVQWKPVTDYSLEARRAIEGIHPQLIRDVFDPKEITDAGCGPGHLVTLLRELGLHAYGIDRQVYPEWYGYPKREPNELIPPHELRPIFETLDIADACEVECCEHARGWDADLVICREVLEHLQIRQIKKAISSLFRLSSRYVYITTRFSDAGVFGAETDFDTDPTHITCLSQPFLRSLCVLNGGKRRRDLESQLDWQNKGRCLVYEL